MDDGFTWEVIVRGGFFGGDSGFDWNVIVGFLIYP
jgi:hypothetical protein